MLSGTAIIGAISALAAMLICSANSVAAPEAPTAARPAVRDGSHDFDFFYGKWRMPNHRLKKRLAGSHEWVDFNTCDEGSPLPGGIGDTDYWRASFWKDFVGVTVRTYDRKTGFWRIYWVDNTFSEGVMGPPVVGKFDGNVGTFRGSDSSNGVPVIVRFTWTVNRKGLPVTARWEQTLNPNGLPVVAKWSRRSPRTAARPGKPTGTTNSSMTITAHPRHDSV